MSTYSCLLIINVSLLRDKCSANSEVIPANQLIASPSKPRNSHLIDTRNINPTYGMIMTQKLKISAELFLRPENSLTSQPICILCVVEFVSVIEASRLAYHYRGQESVSDSINFISAIEASSIDCVCTILTSVYHMHHYNYAVHNKN